MDNPLRVAKRAPEQLVDPPVPPEPPEPPYVTGGPSFPQRTTDSGRYGISILDYFAAHVMNGLAARQDLPIDELKNSGAQHAYWIAALMVDVRGKLLIEPTPVPTEETAPVSETIAPPLPMGPVHGTVYTSSGPVMDLRPPSSATSA